jgi:hypothetical protein
MRNNSSAESDEFAVFSSPLFSEERLKWKMSYQLIFSILPTTHNLAFKVHRKGRKDTVFPLFQEEANSGILSKGRPVTVGCISYAPINYLLVQSC